MMGELIAEKYRVIGVMGEGGMGVVLEAVHVDLDTHVAIKVVREDLVKVESVVARLMLEARAAAKIRSPHVAKVLDVGALPTGAPYIVMEHLTGSDLYAVVCEQGPLPVETAVDYLSQACEALAEAHSLGVVHRDLKPENLFLAEQPHGSSIVKVLDFGISKVTGTGSIRDSEQALTGATATMGSPHYMSPEQMRASTDVDERTDIYALGAILLELLTGKPPFDADSVPELCGQVLATPAPRSRTRRPELPEVLDDIIDRCLSKDREARYSSVAELAGVLAPFGSQVARGAAHRASEISLRQGAASGHTRRSASLPRQPTAPTRVSAQSTTGVTLNEVPPAARRTPLLIAVAVVVAGLVVVLGIFLYRRGATDALPTASADAPSAEIVPAAPVPTPVEAVVEPAPAPEAAPPASAAPSAAPKEPAVGRPAPAPVAKPKPGKAADPFKSESFGGRN